MYTNPNTINYLNNVSVNITKKFGMSEFKLTETEFANIRNKLIGPSHISNTKTKILVRREPIGPSLYYRSNV